MIHPTAIISPDARIAADAEIGPFTSIGKDVEIASGTRIASNVVVEGPTTIGRDNQVHSFCSIGGPPQDKKYAGEPTRLEIGDRNVIREFCTFNRGTTQDVGVTRVGNDNWVMAYAHIAHDCQVGSHTIFANNAQLAGHVQVGDFAILGGFTVVHQFVRIGAHSLTAMGTILLQDLPPFVTAAGNTARPHGINSEGLKRRGYTTAVIAAIKAAYKVLYKSGLSLEDARGELERRLPDFPDLEPLTRFLRTGNRGIIR